MKMKIKTILVKEIVVLKRENMEVVQICGVLEKLFINSTIEIVINSNPMITPSQNIIFTKAVLDHISIKCSL